MIILKGQFLIFLIIYISESSGVLDAPYDAVERIWKLYATLDELNLTNLSNPEAISELLDNDAEINKKVKDQMYEIHDILNEIEDSVNIDMNKNLITIVTSTVTTLKCITEMNTFIDSIANSYKTFHRKIIQAPYIHHRLIRNSTASMLSDIASNIGMIRNIMTDPNKMLPGESSLIAAISRYIQSQDKEICKVHQSTDEILVHVFKIAILAEIKTSVMLPLANLQRCANYQDWVTMNTDAIVGLRKYFGSYTRIMHQSLNLTVRPDIRACDPTDGWILDQNYYGLNETNQAVIFRYDQSVCPQDTCQDMWQQRHTQCDASYYDERSGCSNTPTDCKNLGAEQACVLKKGFRKLKYVYSTLWGFSGDNFKCPEDDGYIIDNGLNSVNATCGCRCPERHNKISLAIMKSEISTNRIIVGVRFRLSNGILHIQPRQKKLEANGKIQRFSGKWMEIPKDIEESQIHSFGKDTSYFFLDDVFLPPEFVMTGIKFNKVERGVITGLAIEIFGVRFDYRSGQLDPESEIQLSSSWKDSGNTQIFIPMSSFDVKKDNITSPNMGYIPAQEPFITNNQLPMLPLFDAVPILTNPSSILGGIGIFHKKIEYDGRLIALRAYGINYSPYFENVTSAPTIDE